MKKTKIFEKNNKCVIELFSNCYTEEEIIFFISEEKKLSNQIKLLRIFLPLFVLFLIFFFIYFSPFLTYISYQERINIYILIIVSTVSLMAVFFYSEKYFSLSGQTYLIDSFKNKKLKEIDYITLNNKTDAETKHLEITSQKEGSTFLKTNFTRFNKQDWKKIAQKNFSNSALEKDGYIYGYYLKDLPFENIKSKAEFIDLLVNIDKILNRHSFKLKQELTFPELDKNVFTQTDVLEKLKDEIKIQKKDSFKELNEIDRKISAIEVMYYEIVNIKDDKNLDSEIYIQKIKEITKDLEIK